MKDMLWILAGGGVLYLLYSNGFFGQQTAAPVSSGAGQSTTPQGNDTTSAGGGANATGGGSVTGGVSTLTNIFNNVNAAASAQYGIDANITKASSGQYIASSYVWNAYLAFVQPSPPAGYSGPQWPPAPSDFIPGSVGVNNQINLTTYWSYLQSFLQSQGLSGLGMIAHRVNPYTQGPRTNTQAFGAALVPRIMETYIVNRG